MLKRRGVAEPLTPLVIDFFDDPRQERKRKRETRRERRISKRSVDSAINSAYYHADDVIEQLEYDEDEFYYNDES